MLRLVRDIGWEVVYGPNIAPDSDKPARDAYNQVILENVLTAAIIRLNPHLPEECTEQVLSQLLKPQSLDLQVNNHAFHEMLIKGVPVTYKKDGETEHDHAFLIDFENVKNNRFQAINQFTVTGTKQPRRPDIICFVNGLPIAVLELKILQMKIQIFGMPLISFKPIKMKLVICLSLTKQMLLVMASRHVLGH